MASAHSIATPHSPRSWVTVLVQDVLPVALMLVVGALTIAFGTVSLMPILLATATRVLLPLVAIGLAIVAGRYRAQ
jgi:hypothetical protein